MDVALDLDVALDAAPILDVAEVAARPGDLSPTSTIRDPLHRHRISFQLQPTRARTGLRRHRHQPQCHSGTERIQGLKLHKAKHVSHSLSSIAPLFIALVA